MEETVVPSEEHHKSLATFSHALGGSQTQTVGTSYVSVDDRTYNFPLQIKLTITLQDAGKLEGEDDVLAIVTQLTHKALRLAQLENNEKNTG